MSRLPQRDLCWIDPDRISTADETFRVRFGYPDSLRESIRSSGIRAPLLVQSLGDRYRLISGWGRWEALARESPGSPIPCFVLPPDTLDEELWDAFLRDNERWSVVEIARILKRLGELPGMTKDRIVGEKFGLIGLRRAKDLYAAHLRLLDLPADAQRFIQEEGLPLRRAGVFFKLPAENLPEFVLIARDLRLTSSELSEVLTLLEETSQRDDVAPLTVMKAALSAERPCTKPSFLRALRDGRYPERSRYRAQLEAWTRELSFSAPVRIEWDSELERPGLRLIADLADADALEDFRRELESEAARLERFFEIL